MEMESILALVTSSLAQKKKVSEIKKSAYQGQVSDQYIASFDGGSGYQIVINSDDDVQKAKRYLEIKDLVVKLEDRNEEILKTFKDSIEGEEYTEIDFDIELSELNKLSKIGIYSLHNFKPEHFHLFVGSINDYENYQKALIEIKTSVETLEKKYSVLF